MRKYVERFHYITQDLGNHSHLDQVRMACEAGAKWIQYRCLTRSDEELIPEIEEVAAICDDWGSTLILTDHYHLLDKVDAQGVHIEDMDADFGAIRESIGDDKTLGASANTIDQIKRLAATQAVDYIGCGPFAVTETKPNDYPLLGFNGYGEIVKQMQAMGIEIPIIAVGGIELADVEGLMASNIYGIAVCGAINSSEDPGAAFHAFYQKLY